MFWALRRLGTKMADFESGRLRGFCVAHDTQYLEQDIIDLKATGANVMRVPLHWHGEAQPDLAVVRQMLKWGAAHEVRVIVVMATIEQDYWTDPHAQQGLIAAWRWVAGELKWSPALQAYDIINEPVGQRFDLEQKTHWLSISQCIATAIRAADARTPIMIEPCWWGQPGSFWLTLPVKVTGLVCSFHFYELREYVYQGIEGLPAPVDLPPDTAFVDVLEARKFAELHKLPMFVGEFSCVRRAPGATEWVRRTEALFASLGWGWTYHCFRAWEGWDSEIPADKWEREPGAPTMTVLQAAMRQ